MATLKTFDLKGNKQSFASWISNLSPCETPFISMIPKESVDQVQYSWQTDSLSKANNTGVEEGAAFASATLTGTTVHTNFTKIFRKGVRVSDTTKKVGLWGRGSELAYQMEKAGMEIKRDVEFYLLNHSGEGAIGGVGTASECSGVQKLVAAIGAEDADTGAIVHKVHSHGADDLPFTKEAIFEMTYNLYLVGSRANKIMVHPKYVHVFSDFIADANHAKAKPRAPHLHRMFDGMDSKYNVFVNKIRDPLGQEFEIIPNRFMPASQLFFFNEKDWTQMVLRAPEKTELGRTGSTQKFMIEMEVGLRHKNPFASGILELVQTNKAVVRDLTAKPINVPLNGNNEVVSEVSVNVIDANGAAAAGVEVDFSTVTLNDDGAAGEATVADVTAAAAGKATAKVKHNKGARVKVKAAIKDANHLTDSATETLVDFYAPDA